MCNKRCEYNNPTPVSIVIPWVFWTGSTGLQEDGVVYIKRKNEPQAGGYALPGGFVDAYEHPMDAAARELKEETGLTAGPLKLLEVYLSKERNQIVFCYITGLRKLDNLKPGDDALECLIHHYSSNHKEFMDSLAFDSHKQAIKKYYGL